MSHCFSCSIATQATQTQAITCFRFFGRRGFLSGPNCGRFSYSVYDEVSINSYVLLETIDPSKSCNSTCGCWQNWLDLLLVSTKYLQTPPAPHAIDGTASATRLCEPAEVCATSHHSKIRWPAQNVGPSHPIRHAVTTQGIIFRQRHGCWNGLSRLRLIVQRNER